MQEEQEEKKELKNLKKPKKIVISKRDTLVNDIKNGTAEGILSLVFAVLGVLLFLFGIYHSFRAAGNAGYEIGIIMLMTLISAGASVALAVIGFRNREKTRHYMETRGLVISLVLIGVLIVVFVRGAILYARGI